MRDLADLKCTPCRNSATPLSDIETRELQTLLPDWQLEEREGVQQIERVFSFKNYRDALQFTSQVGEIAEIEDHHPAILTEWDRVTVTWWTHNIRGLHRNDFIMAAKTDQLYP